ncbi:MAG: hypothetical protein HYZ81_21810 [Nitrospinae bacterium]|nr:hypothetical protein [Nitrospinota bacterium]
MRVLFSDRFTRAFRDAPDRVQRQFGTQLAHLLRSLRHPSLRAKKYDEAKDIWQARVNGGGGFSSASKAISTASLIVHLTPNSLWS